MHCMHLLGAQAVMSACWCATKSAFLLLDIVSLAMESKRSPRLLMITMEAS